jgi:hypothetical protein
MKTIYAPCAPQESALADKGQTNTTASKGEISTERAFLSALNFSGWFVIGVLDEAFGQFH